MASQEQHLKPGGGSCCLCQQGPWVQTRQPYQASQKQFLGLLTCFVWGSDPRTARRLICGWWGSNGVVGGVPHANVFPRHLSWRLVPGPDLSHSPVDRILPQLGSCEFAQAPSRVRTREGEGAERLVKQYKRRQSRNSGAKAREEGEQGVGAPADLSLQLRNTFPRPPGSVSLCQ